MNSLVLTVAVSCFFATHWCIAEAETDDQVASRNDVIDFAGAFQNDGFKIRDGNYYGKVSMDQSAVVAVNLYNGNAYWFTASTGEKPEKLKVSVFDEAGNP
ncbi:MAG TPA: hypothetical protein VF207_08580, partial [Chthoniobacterales bacterium]